MQVNVDIYIATMVEGNGNYWFTASINRAEGSRYDAFGVESHKDLGRVVYEAWSLAKALGIEFDAHYHYNVTGNNLLNNGNSTYSKEDFENQKETIDLMTYNWWEK